MWVHLIFLFFLNFYILEASKDERIVFPWQELTPFQRLLLLKVIRPDMLTGAVRSFLHDLLGPKFLSTGTVDLREVFEEASAKTPLIFILSPGKNNFFVSKLCYR